VRSSLRRDLCGIYEPDPDGQVWARSMADLLIWANAQATAARAAGKPRLDDAVLAEIRSWYRCAVARGIAGNQDRRSKAGKDGLRLARRFRSSARSPSIPRSARCSSRSRHPLRPCGLTCCPLHRFWRRTVMFGHECMR
jgi:hypothetical protein